MRQPVERFYVVEFPTFRRIFVATFRQQKVGDKLVEVYVLHSLHHWTDLTRAKDKDGNEHDWSILELFQAR